MYSMLRISVICLVIALALPTTAADFSMVGMNTFSWEGLFTAGRLSALGGSDLADNSPAALLINPAPLFRGNGVGISYDHTNHFDEYSEITTYAGAAEWNYMRLNIAVQDFEIDSAPIRTAYNPEGTGETFDGHNRMTVLGLSYDFGAALLDIPAFRWSAGLAWRGYSGTVGENSGTAHSFDLGTTLSWRTEYRGGWTSLTGAASWQNVSDTIYTFNERSTLLPRPRRTGLTLETAFERSGQSEDFLKLMLAYSRVTGSPNRLDSNHIGAEALFFNVLALRYGHNTRVAGGITSWGAGVLLGAKFLGPLTVELDIGEMAYDNEDLTGKSTIWGARVRYQF